MWTVIYWVIVFGAGLCIGMFLRGWIFYKRQGYSGTIVVNKDRLSEKTVYSLILDEYPDKLEFKKVVIFKVDSSDQSSDRN
jgi:hypothetical protein